MNISKRNIVNYIAAGLLICFLLGFTAVQAAAAGKLTLSLQTSLDGEGDIKATSITMAQLTSPDGTVAINGNVSGGTASFDMSGIVAGDYFIMVNDLSDDLVPTRIDDTATDINQFVGQKLRVTVIGNLTDPTYRIMTFSKGQGEHPVVVYSDGSDDIPEQYAYALLSLNTSPQKLEINVLGTASQLNSYSPGTPIHPSTSTAVNPAFSDWMLGDNSHAYDYNGTDSKCIICHSNMDTKPPSFTQVASNNGWCYRCHYGKEGIDNGFIDAARETPVSTTPPPTTTTEQPVATTKTPGFESILAISALLITVLAKRK